MNVIVKLNKEEIKIKEGTKTKNIISDLNKEVFAVRVNNEVHSLNYPLVENSIVECIRYDDMEGKRIYSRTLKFVFLMACYSLNINLNDIEFTNKIGGNYFIEFLRNTLNSISIEDIKEKMNEIIKEDYLITKEKVSYERARKIYKNMHSENQLLNFRINIKDSYTFYRCNNYYNYLYGLLAPSTGYIKYFDIKKFDGGAMLELPKEPESFSSFSKNIFEEFSKFREFEQKINVSRVSDINMQVLGGTIGTTIRYSEADHNRRLVEIVDKISTNPNIKAIFIAGPSSSGKTTFSQKLEIQLKIIGKRAVPVSMDNYFKDYEDIPLDKNGHKDYESIENVDLDLFSNQINNLLKGNSVTIPRYNFQKSKKEYIKKNIIVLEQNDVLIIEGIHALNPRVHDVIKNKSMIFKIYLAPLVTLGLDNFSKISSNDTRLIRRIVRDADSRGIDIETTLKNWKKVRDAENRNIFPFVNTADIIYNTNLVYELGVLKPFAVNLLLKVSENSEYYSDARRLYKTLNNFLTIETTEIPLDSVIKEFIGRGCFYR